jgi:hypothetical protein
MPPIHDIRHFAINADDPARARAFYQQVFGWRIEPWGPPEFFQIRTGDEAQPGVRGALQKRRELVPGKPTTGFECTIAVDDIDAVTKAIVASGGRIVMDKTTIAGVGDLVFFEDTEGNVAGAMRYDKTAE